MIWAINQLMDGKKDELIKKKPTLPEIYINYMLPMNKLSKEQKQNSTVFSYLWIMK